MSLRSKLQHAKLLVAGPAAPRRAFLHVIRMWMKGVDLRGVSTQSLGLDERRSTWYSDSGGSDLDEVFRTLPITTNDALLDFGCGKGGALITLSRYPFERVDGIEISPELTQTARRNLERLSIAKSQVFCSDATEFTELDGYTYVYMYHPFLEPVMKHVLANLCASLRRKPRSLTLVYKNPVCDPLVLESGFFPVQDFTHSTDLFRVYRHP